MTVLRTTIFGGIKYKPNTFIGGVSSVMNTKESVAYYLKTTPQNIKNLKISGSNISFHAISTIDMDYNVIETVKRTNMTYFKDTGKGGVLKNLSHRAFYRVDIMTELELHKTDIDLLTTANYAVGNSSTLTSVKLHGVTVSGQYFIVGCPNLVNLEVPNLVTLSINAFINNNSALPLLDIKKCKFIGLADNSGSVFSDTTFTSTAVLNVNSFLLTSNGGGVNYYLTALKILKPSIVINFYDDAGNYVSTL